MIYVILGLLGTITGGAYLVGRGGVVLGALTGLLLAAVIELRNRLQIHEQRLAAMEKRLAEELSNRAAASTATDGAPDQAPAAADTMDQESTTIVPMIGTDAIDAASRPTTPADAGDDLVAMEFLLDDGVVADSEPSTPKLTADSTAERSNAAGDRVRARLFGGNLVVRIGVVVLLFGFAFGIGSAWGVQYYRPPYLATTEPFLIRSFGIPCRERGWLFGRLYFSFTRFSCVGWMPRGRKEPPWRGMRREAFWRSGCSIGRPVGCWIDWPVAHPSGRRCLDVEWHGDPQPL